MKRIAIYGCGKKAKELLNIINDEKPDYKIVYFILTNREEDSFMGYPVRILDETNPSEFDVLIIATSLFRDEIIELIGNYQNGAEYLAKIKGLSNIDEQCPYKSVQIHTLGGEKIVYLYNREDKIIPGHMEITGHNWSDRMIEDFFSLVHKNKKEFSDDGIFFDIGANIGTTSVYVAKQYPNMKVIGFEPMKENYYLLRANVDLNKVTNVICENLALSDEEGEVLFQYNRDNSGDSHLVENGSSKDIEKVITKTIDGYVQEKGLHFNDIQMIWMDCQGFEAPILQGAKDLLQENPIPLLMEYNYDIYQKRGELPVIISVLNGVYSSFVNMNDETKTVHGITELDYFTQKLIEKEESYTDIFLF